MLFIYNTGIKIYFFSILIASLFNEKAKQWIQGRKQIFHQIQFLENKNEIRYWFHCASLGEFEQGRPLIEQIKKSNPEIKIVLTFFSPSGYLIRKDYEFADYIFYLPSDSKQNAIKFIELVNPQKVFFVKYEFWYYYLARLHNKKIPSYLISAIFRKNQLFFKWYGGWYRNLLQYFSIIFVQNIESQKLLANIGCKNTIVSGDTRFDRVLEIAQQDKKITLLDKYLTSKKVFVAGSTWQKDEEILINFINQNPSDFVYVIVPHNVDNTNIKSVERKLNVPHIKYSSIIAGQEVNEEKVIIIDSIGVLSSLYKYATITYVGGGFGAGIHNILEACVFGSPVIFGPNYHKFSEANDAIRLEFGFSIQNKSDFEKIMNSLANNQLRLLTLKSIINKYFVNQKGASETILKII
ncbi:MAG: hypothetical protein A2W98_04850 [Bacteroidetes bacterium GWF2_33_38]|nr:MAG: hypothetical protein A2W98_04850 [Bacteroidetes bacterium GWF2_33_38]OFY76145.1 MAG: hypothetical protein A2265_07685 [Bacteroidetes bacterium RIFOXYA12_FULL_33_9]OFY90741.1 MAG: hypothetical protein A2236_05540 [Bacteroidetes bacterium RIFOXYA2_FULL_33_7]